MPIRAAYDYRIMYVFGGTGCIVIDSIRHKTMNGTLFFWKPGIFYELLPDGGQTLSLIGINFDFTQTGSSLHYPLPPEAADRFHRDNIIATAEFHDIPCFNQVICLTNMQAAESQLLEMEKEFVMRKRFYMHKIRGLFLLLLGNIARRASGMVNEQSINHADQILQYIREHYDKPLTNQQIGDHFNFHPVYLNRMLVRYTGTSLHQYLIGYRLSLAVGLMQNPGRTVTEVAFESGFNDVNHFSNCFKKRFGLSPKRYMKVAKSMNT
jgi:AraC-like DNA-binding protein